MMLCASRPQAAEPDAAVAPLCGLCRTLVFFPPTRPGDGLWRLMRSGVRRLGWCGRGAVRSGRHAHGTACTCYESVHGVMCGCTDEHTGWTDASLRAQERGVCTRCGAATECAHAKERPV